MGRGVCTRAELTPVSLWPQVAVVRQRDSGQIFAMKMLHKWEMLKRAEVSLGSDGTWASYQRARGGDGGAASGVYRAYRGRGRQCC